MAVYLGCEVHPDGHHEVDDGQLVAVVQVAPHFGRVVLVPPQVDCLGEQRGLVQGYLEYRLDFLLGSFLLRLQDQIDQDA